MIYAKKEFPDGFHWGTATSAFQIEGATKEDGRGESIWDRYSYTPGMIHTGETGDPAADSYHRYAEDVALMKTMGLNGYRFSIAWPRIFSDGKGKINEKGLEYYDRVVDCLLKNEIEPFVTLNHWDLPQALQDRGGWNSRDTVQAYLDYTSAVVRRLGDRVKQWMTHNEPYCIAFLGNLTGEHAPGIHDRKTAVQVSHHLLVSHGLAVPLIRENSPRARVGIVLNLAPAYPAADSDADRQKADLAHAIANTWFLDPLCGRGYPQLALDHYQGDAPRVEDGDMKVIAAPIDFLGVNYYMRTVSHLDDSPESVVINYHDPVNVTARNWEVNPEGLYDLLVWLNEEYAFPELMITENGADFHDLVAADGRVNDPLRQKFIKDHLTAAWHAVQMGVPLTGYFCWSLLDNFEWAFGTSSRFGLTYVDFATQKRTLKESGKWYARAARSNQIV